MSEPQKQENWDAKLEDKIVEYGKAYLFWAVVIAVLIGWYMLETWIFGPTEMSPTEEREYYSDDGPQGENRWGQ